MSNVRTKNQIMRNRILRALPDEGRGTDRTGRLAIIAMHAAKDIFEIDHLNPSVYL